MAQTTPGRSRQSVQEHQREVTVRWAALGLEAHVMLRPSDLRGGVRIACGRLSRMTRDRAGPHVRARLRCAAQLHRFLRHPMSAEEIRGILRTRLERRAADFLKLVRQVIYDNPDSPYRALLALAGCEWEDVARLVGQGGIEGALRTLLRHG